MDKNISSANTIKSLIRNSKLEELSETEDLWSQYRDEKSKETQIESQIKQLIESDQSLLNRNQQITAYKQMDMKYDLYIYKYNTSGNQKQETFS